MARLIDQHRSFIEALYLKAVEDDLAWEETGTGGVRTQVGVSSISLTKEVDFNNQPSIRIEISDSQGQVVDSFDDNYFGSLTPQRTSFQEYWPLISELHTTGMRSARGADKVLAQLLQSLDAKPIETATAVRRAGFAEDLEDDVPF